MPKKLLTGLNSEVVKEYGINAGASVVGIAASKDFNLAPNGFKPTDNLENCLSVVVLGAPISKEAILKDTTIGFIDIRSRLNEKMTDIAKNVAKQIKTSGYKTKVINGLGGKSVNGQFFGHISLKHAVELAGLGVIGKNYLLYNSEYGNLLWFSAVLTDANLVSDKKVKYKICNNCNKCVEMCPVNVLDNINSFRKKECSGTVFKKINGKWEIMCFLCRKVCLNRFGKNI